MRTERIYRATAHYATMSGGYNVVKYYRSRSAATAWRTRRLAGYAAQTLVADGIERPAIRPAATVSIEVSAPVRWEGAPIEVVHAGPGHYVVAKGERVVEVHSDRIGSYYPHRPTGTWRVVENGRIIGGSSHLRQILRTLQMVL